MIQSIFVARYEHLGGSEFRVFASADGCERWRQELARQCWEEELDEPIPKDHAPRVIADIYFARMSGRETFEITKTIVEVE